MATLGKEIPRRISGLGACVDVISGQKALVLRCADTMPIFRIVSQYKFAHCDIHLPFLPTLNFKESFIYHGSEVFGIQCGKIH